MSPKNKDVDSIAMMVMSVGVAAAVSFAVVAVRLGEGFAIPVGIAASVAFAVAMKGPLGQALARRITGDTGNREALDVELGEIRTRLEQLETERDRITELEERLDFTERVLAQSQEPAKLAQPGREDA